MTVAISFLPYFLHLVNVIMNIKRRKILIFIVCYSLLKNDSIVFIYY